MRRPIIAATAAFAVLALAPTPAAVAGQRYASDTEQFEVTVPDGWVHVGGKGGRIDLAMISPRFRTSLGLCVVVSEATAETRDMSQAQLNELMAADINEAFWRTAISQDPYAKDATVESRSETRGERRVALATVHFTLKLKDGDVATRAELSLHAVPGRMVMSQCAASQAEYASETTDIKSVIDTLNPIGGLVAGIQPGVRHMTAPRRMSASAAVAVREGVRAMIDRINQVR